MAPVQRKLRKALGAMKDQTSIGLAKVASSRAPDLDIAVVKATSHAESPIDEKYVYELLHYMSYSRAYVNACVAAIAKRLSKTRNWVVALKSLMLVHRLLRDGDPSFEEELSYSHRGMHLLNMSGFRDQSSSSAWDYTAFVKTYSMYLDERLRSFSAKVPDPKRASNANDGGRKFNTYSDDVESPRTSKKEQVIPTKDMKPEALLQRLPDLQQLLERVVGCRPTGAARSSRLVQVALYPVVTESGQIYADVFDGVTVLLNAFFDLEYDDCVKALDIYKLSSKQGSSISSFYGLCKNIGIGRPVDYPTVQPVSQEHVETLEDYVRNAPRSGRKQRPRSRSPEPEVHRIPSSPPKSESVKVQPPQARSAEFSNRGQSEKDKTPDLLNMDEPAANPVEEQNHLALALFSATTEATQKWEPFGASSDHSAAANGSNTSSVPAYPTVETGKAGWELALVEESTNIRARSQMAGGFDNLLLESMYEQGAANQVSAASSVVGGSASSVALPNRAAATYLALPAPPGASPVAGGSQDPFAASATVPPPAYVQMEDLKKKQDLLVQEQQAWQRYQASGMQGYHGFMKVNNNPYLTANPTGFNYFSNGGNLHSSYAPGPYAQY